MLQEIREYDKNGMRGFGLVLGYVLGFMVRVTSVLSFPKTIIILKGDTDAVGVGLNILNL